MIILFLFTIKMPQTLSIQFDIIGRMADIIPADNYWRIVNGQPCAVEDHPYMVSMRTTHNMKHFCGGTILSPKSVLTAAHCVVDFENDPSIIMAVAGLTANNSTRQMRQVKSIHIPPSFSAVTMTGDLSVLTLLQSFDLNDVVQPVSISPRHSSDVVKFCPVGLIIGWGYNRYVQPKSKTEQLMRCAKVPVISYWQCQKYLNLFMDKSKFCAVGKGVDACLGDSGGPMMCDGVQIGVISSGNGCGAHDHPGLYARVDYHFRYIKRMMNGQRKCANSLLSHQLQLLCLFDYLIQYWIFSR